MRGNWKVGDRVLVFWENTGKDYPGILKEFRNNLWTVSYEADGSWSRESAADLKKHPDDA